MTWHRIHTPGANCTDADANPIHSHTYYDMSDTHLATSLLLQYITGLTLLEANTTWFRFALINTMAVVLNIQSSDVTLLTLVPMSLNRRRLLSTISLTCFFSIMSSPPTGNQISAVNALNDAVYDGSFQRFLAKNSRNSMNGTNINSVRGDFFVYTEPSAAPSPGTFLKFLALIKVFIAIIT